MQQQLPNNRQGKKYLVKFSHMLPIFILIILATSEVKSQQVGEGNNLGAYFSSCMAGNCPSIPIGDPAAPQQTYTYSDQSFSAYIGGDLTVPSNGGGEIEGKLAVGGNLVLQKSGYTIGSSGGGSLVVGPSNTSDSWANNDFSDDNLIIAGDVSGDQSNYIGGDAIIGGSILGSTVIGRSFSASNFTQSGVGASNVGIDFNFANYQLGQKSSDLTSRTVTGTFSVSYGEYTFIGDGVSMLQVFNVDDNLVGWELNFENIPADATVIINIAGATRTINISGYITGAYREHVVYNFHQATNVTLKGEVDGTVLIPDPASETTIAGNVHGRLLTAGDVLHSGSGVEVHNYPFAGNIPEADDSPLPVELIHFHGEAKGNIINLKWITASEVNNDHFEIQRAVSGMKFKTIGMADGAGNSNEKIVYTYTDHNPGIGKIYYRLKQVDHNGEFSFSEIRTVKLSKTAKMNIYPNPAQHFVHITTSTKGWLEIRDQSGSIVIKKKIDTDKLTLNLSGLANGIYVAIFITGNDVNIRKLVIE